MYKLIVKHNNTWTNVDLGTDAPAMTYQANDLAELKDRQADYSQALKLPLTTNNIKIFDFSNDLTSVPSNGAPYKKLECRLYNDESILAGLNSYIIVLSVDTFFNCQILSGNANFFDALDALDIKIDLGYFRKSIDNIKNNTNPMYKWGIANFVKDEAKTAQLWPGINPVTAQPAVPIHSIALALCNALGFDLETNLTSDQLNIPLLCLPTLIGDSVTNSDMQAKASSVKTFNRTDSWFNFPFTVSNSGFNYLVAEEFGDYPRCVYTAPDECTIKHTLTLNNTGSVGISILIQDSDGYLVNRLYNEILNIDNSDTVLEHVIKLDKGYRVITSLTHDQESVSEILTSTNTLDIAIQEIANIPFNIPVRIPISYNLGFDNALDFFKMYMQIFGFIATVNQVDKIVYLNTYKQYYDNKSKALDWTNKLDQSIDNNFSLEFDLSSYGQENTITMQSADGYQESTSFKVNNIALTKTKNLFEIKVESGTNSIRFYNELDGGTYPMLPANLNYFTLEDGTYSKGSTKPHIVYASMYVRSTIQGDSDIIGQEYPVFTHLTLDFIRDNYYTDLINRVLVNAKKLTINFYLTPIDIENFDPLKPIYLKQYNSYFIVNKISNYVAGSLTKVELIKL